jgi:putative DNA primase/helicase
VISTESLAKFAGIAVVAERNEWGGGFDRGGIVYELAKCPFEPGHIGGSAAFTLDDGKPGFRCQHDGCRGKTIKDVFAVYPRTTGTGIIRETAAPDVQQDSETVSSPDLLGYLHNDHGNAERLIALYGDDIRFCHAFRKWLVWDGMRWAVDDTDQARRLSKQAMLEFLRQAVARGKEDAERFARSSLDSRRISSMLSMAECEVYVRPDELDTDPFALNFINGTVDLRTGELRPHCRMDLITKVVRYRYRPAAPCRRWNAFLNHIMGATSADSDEVSIARAARLTVYLQRAFGYSITGSTIEKAVFVLFGEGNNGKSTMLSTFRQLVEDYSVLLQVDTLMVRQESNNTQADLADLRGARFVQTSESEDGQRLAQGKLKRITQGMGKIKAVRKYDNPIEFAETHKLWLDTNRKPTIRDADDKATFNRLHPIPFVVSIPADEIDKELPAKLLAEAEGILAWAVEGSRLWYTSGLGTPAEITAAKDEWRSQMDQIGRFVEECCVTGEGFRCRASVLYGDYRRWAESAGEHFLTLAAFGTKIGERFRKTRTERGVDYLGIGIVSQEPETRRAVES